MKFTGWVGKLFGIAEKKTENLEDLRLRLKRAYVAKRTILKISERMKARPARMAAYAKQRMRALKRARIHPHKKLTEILDDADYGPKATYYAKGILYKDGLGNHVLEVL